jgi:hypothetical protein
MVGRRPIIFIRAKAPRRKEILLFPIKLTGKFTLINPLRLMRLCEIKPLAYSKEAGKKNIHAKSAKPQRNSAFYRRLDKPY